MDTVDGLIIIFSNTSSLLISLLLPSPSSQLSQLIQQDGQMMIFSSVHLFNYLCIFIYLSSMQIWVFWSWILSALIESLLISILPLIMLDNTDNINGAMDNFLESGMTSFTIIVIVVNTKVSLISNYYHLHHHYDCDHQFRHNNHLHHHFY